MALHQGDLEGRIAPPSSISWMCCHTLSAIGGAICQNLSQKGSLLVTSMTCSVISVQAISFGSRENTE